MPPRLAHKKSRRGCLRCKSRKVKCTEEQPSCAACLRHSLPCHYPQENDQLRIPSITQPPSDPENSRDSSVVGPASPYSLEDDIDALDSEQFQRRLLELRLLFHYVTVVGRTLPASKGDAIYIDSHDTRDIYPVDVVKMAFEEPFLLNTILAISALHQTQPQLEPVPAPFQGPADDLAAVEATGPTAAEVAQYARAHRIYLNMAIRQ